MVTNHKCQISHFWSMWLFGSLVGATKSLLNTSMFWVWTKLSGTEWDRWKENCSVLVYCCSGPSLADVGPPRSVRSLAIAFPLGPFTTGPPQSMGPSCDCTSCTAQRTALLLSLFTGFFKVVLIGLYDSLESMSRLVQTHKKTLSPPTAVTMWPVERALERISEQIFLEDGL